LIRDGQASLSDLNETEFKTLLFASKLKTKYVPYVTEHLTRYALSNI